MNIFYITYVLWILSEIMLKRFFKSKSTDKQGADSNTLRFLWIIIIVAITASAFTAALTSFPIFHDEHNAVLGILIIYIGMIIRFIAVRQLGQFFTVDVTIRSDHKLMNEGLYSNLRHPSYAASLISFVGFGISMNNWLSVPVAFVPVLFSFIHRMNVEEQVLIAHFGDTYREYMKKTKRILPGIY